MLEGDIRLDSFPFDGCIQVRHPPVSGGNVQAGPILQVENQLDGILAEGGLANNFGSPLGFQCTGDDLGGAGRMLVNNYSQGQVGQRPGAFDLERLQCFSLILLLDDDALPQEQSGSVHTCGEQPAEVIPMPA